MIRGSHNTKYIKWEDYYSPNFKPNLDDDYDWGTCGSPILSMITGLKPKTVEKYKPKTQRHWTTRAVKNYLINKGYTVIEVTRINVTNTHWIDYPLTSEHVIILNLEMDSCEASWFLLYDNTLYHNKYEETEFNCLFFLNKPPQNVLVVHHPKWE